MPINQEQRLKDAFDELHRQMALIRPRVEQLREASHIQRIGHLTTILDETRGAFGALLEVMAAAAVLFHQEQMRG